jgi:hypothetical protein
MDRSRVMEILLLYRPHAAEPTDGEMQAALEQMRRDPELRAWFEQHCEQQRIFHAAFSSMPVPAGLRERIADAVALVEPSPWWQRPLPPVFAAAAAIVLLLVAFYLFQTPRRSETFALYRDRMVRQVQRMYQMDMLTNDLQGIRLHLAAHNGHSDYLLPAPMQTLRAFGCAVLKWHGKTVSLICMESEMNTLCYLFVINRSDVQSPPPASPLQFAETGRLLSVSWSAGDKAYLLAAQTNRAFLQRMTGVGTAAP